MTLAHFIGVFEGQETTSEWQMTLGQPSRPGWRPSSRLTYFGAAHNTSYPWFYSGEGSRRLRRVGGRGLQGPSAIPFFLPLRGLQGPGFSSVLSVLLLLIPGGLIL